MSRYKVNDAWPIDEPTNIDDCLKKLVRLSSSGKAVECHGAPRLEWDCIHYTFDIRFFNKNNVTKKQAKDVEKKMLECFVTKAKAHPNFPLEARRFIDVAGLKWNTHYNTGTLFVARHYGLPTRCVDWTKEPLIALFFACWRDCKKTGVVWWMDYNDFSDAISTQWIKAYDKDKNIEDDFEEEFTKGKNRDIISRFHYWRLLERPNKQSAHILLSGLYNVKHDEAIHHLSVRKGKPIKCGRIVIKSKIKSDLLYKLDRRGINSTALGIEHSDIDTIADDVANKFGLGK